MSELCPVRVVCLDNIKMQSTPLHLTVCLYVQQFK